MISRSGYAHDALHIYVRREPLFVQVRFMLHASGGWIDDTEIITKAENYDRRGGVQGGHTMPHIVIKTISGPSQKQLRDAAEQLSLWEE